MKTKYKQTVVLSATHTSEYGATEVKTIKLNYVPALPDMLERLSEWLTCVYGYSVVLERADDE